MADCVALDLPQIEGIRVRVGFAEVPCADKGLHIRVALASGIADAYKTDVTSVAMPSADLDFAHDLSRAGPLAFMTPNAGDCRGALAWKIEVVAFIPTEALVAYERVAEACQQRVFGTLSRPRPT
jgi:hypothetical protein